MGFNCRRFGARDQRVCKYWIPSWGNYLQEGWHCNMLGSISAPAIHGNHIHSSKKEALGKRSLEDDGVKCLVRCLKTNLCASRRQT